MNNDGLPTEIHTAEAASQSKQQEFLVTARKWRPLQFSSVVGQNHISVTLSNAIRSGRVHHAYLFCGPRGVGKTTTARIFARALNCTNSIDGIEPCNSCESCMGILTGRSMDVIEIDGASNNSVDDIRKLRENAKYPPVYGKYKLYIIDEVHMLSTSAFNALLKTLEEPPPHLMFVFATTESHKVPATIVSRCQRFDFRRMEIDTIVTQLGVIAKGEGMTIDEESLVAIAKKGDGSMRDSQSIFDQVRAFCGNSITYTDVTKALHLIDEDFFFTVSTAICNHNVKQMFEIARVVMANGYDVIECLHGLLEHFRNILTVLATGNTSLIESSKTIIERYRKESELFNRADVLRIMTLINSSEHSIKNSPQPRIRFELLLSQLASLDSTVEIAKLLADIEEIKKNGNLNVPLLSKSSQQELQPQRQPPAPAPVLVSTVAETNHSSTYSVAEKTTQEINKTPQVQISTPKQQQQTESAQTVSPNVGITQSKSVNQRLSKNQLEQGWSEFAQSLPPLLAGTKIALTSPSISTVRFYDDEVLIYLNEKFICDDLTHRKPAFQKALEKYFGSIPKFSIIYCEDFSTIGGLSYISDMEEIADTIRQNGITTHIPSTISESNTIYSTAETNDEVSLLEISPANSDSVNYQDSSSIVTSSQPITLQPTITNIENGTLRKINNDATDVRTTSVINDKISSTKSNLLELEETIISLFGARKVPVSRR
jgi:DNA polymerase III subunit gamma/tau